MQNGSNESWNFSNYSFVRACFKRFGFYKLPRGQRGVRLHDDIVGDFALANDQDGFERVGKPSQIGSLFTCQHDFSPSYTLPALF